MGSGWTEVEESDGEEKVGELSFTDSLDLYPDKRTPRLDGRIIK